MHARSSERAHPAARAGPPRPRAAAVLAVAAAGILAAGSPGSAQQTVEPGLTVYTQDRALVRTTVDRPFPTGERTVRIDGFTGNIETGSLVLLDPDVTLRGVHGQRSYQSPEVGRAVSLALDLAVERGVDGLRMAYITRGLSWTPGYTMVVDRDDRSARFAGYATVSNRSGTLLRNAAVQLLAGTTETRGRGGRVRVVRQGDLAPVATLGAPAGVSRQPFSAFHLYDLEAPLTLHPGASRRIRLLGTDSVPVVLQYVMTGEVNHFRRQASPQREEALMRYRVERPEGPAFSEVPLPKGTVRIFQPDREGRLQLIGTDEIPNTPARQEPLLAVGRAFDVGGVRTQTEYRRLDGNVRESAWEVALDNRSDEDVVVHVFERLEGDGEIVAASHEARRLSASRAVFDVPVPADGEATLTYRVRVRR